MTTTTATTATARLAIINVLRDHPEGLTRDQIAALSGTTMDDVWQAQHRLMALGWITKQGSGKHVALYPSAIPADCGAAMPRGDRPAAAPRVRSVTRVSTVGAAGEIIVMADGRRAILSVEPRYVARVLDGSGPGRELGVSDDRHELAVACGVDWVATMALAAIKATVLEPKEAAPAGAELAAEVPAPADAPPPAPTAAPAAFVRPVCSHTLEREVEVPGALAEHLLAMDEDDASDAAGVTSDLHKNLMSTVKAAAAALDAGKEAGALQVSMSDDPIADLVEVDLKHDRMVVGMDAAAATAIGEIKGKVATEFARYVFRRRNPKLPYKGPRYSEMVTAAVTAAQAA